MGLGYNTIEGREQKHQMIAKYAGDTTYQNRWPMIFRHEHMQLIYLRENGYDNIKYIKQSSNYADKDETKSCSLCNLGLKETEKDFPLRLSSLMISIKNRLKGIP